MRKYLGELTGLGLVAVAIAVWWWLVLAFVHLELNVFEWSPYRRTSLVLLWSGHFGWWDWRRSNDSK